MNFLSENFPFLVVKFSIYLNKRVFAMAALAGSPDVDIYLTNVIQWLRK